MRGGQIAGFFTLALIGVIIADVLAHPTGTKAFLNSGNSILRTTFSAVGGK